MNEDVEALTGKLTARIAALSTEIGDKRVEVYLCQRERGELMMGRKPAVVRAILKEHGIVLA
jgi:hypothetical protein